jgi:uncharacterized protein (DUF2141 family)
MNISLRHISIVLLASAAVMLLSQCCNCGVQPPPAIEEESDDEMETVDGDTEEVPDTTATSTSDKTTEKPDATTATPAETAKKQKPLSITITDLKSATAPVIFSVYENPDTYLDPKAQLKTYRFVPKSKTLKIKLTDLKFGTYAIAFYQDMNDNGKIDKNGLGIPKEPYAFSNNIRPKLSAPSFKDCKFNYSKNQSVISVKMGK